MVLHRKSKTSDGSVTKLGWCIIQSWRNLVKLSNILFILFTDSYYSASWFVLWVCTVFRKCDLGIFVHSQDGIDILSLQHEWFTMSELQVFILNALTFTIWWIILPSESNTYAHNLVLDHVNNFHLISLNILIACLLDNVWIL